MDNTQETKEIWDVTVIGGGPAGLAAAALTAKAGKKVVLLEKGPRLGGRAASVRENGATLNLGAHALYRSGPAASVLRQLDAWPSGKSPSYNISWVPDEGRGKIVTTAGLLTGRTFNGQEKRKFLQFFLGLRMADPYRAHGISFTKWLDNVGLTGRARDVACALARLSTYVGDSDVLDAGSAIQQLKNLSVIYPNGGWQSMVDRLEASAVQAGAACRTSAYVTGISRRESGQRGWVVHLKSGGSVLARNLICAVEPEHVTAWFEPWLRPSYSDRLKKLRPVFVSALDLHLRRLPRPNLATALGLDRPLYFSAHSHWAKLCDNPEHAVVHLMRYDGNKREDADAAKAELEAFMDRVQPGWRGELLRERYLPHVIVTHGLPAADMYGAAGRPAVDTGIEGVFVAGDWAGSKGLLLDAALHSAREAAAFAVRN